MSASKAIFMAKKKFYYKNANIKYNKTIQTRTFKQDNRKKSYYTIFIYLIYI